MRKAVLIVREFDEFTEILRRENFEVINFQAIRTAPVKDFAELDRKIDGLQNYDGLFLTSPKAAEVFLKRLREKGASFRGKVYVLGKRTAELLEGAQLEIVFRAGANTAEELIDSFESAEFAGKRFLFLRGDKSLRAIPALLGKIAEIDETVLYRTIENPADKSAFGEISEKLRGGQITRICFFSPSGIESLVKSFGAASLRRARIAAIGKTTAARAAEKGLNVDFVSTRATARDFALELAEYLENEAERPGRV